MNFFLITKKFAHTFFVAKTIYAFFVVVLGPLTSAFSVLKRAVHFCTSYSYLLLPKKNVINTELSTAFDHPSPHFRKVMVKFFGKVDQKARLKVQNLQHNFLD